MGYLVFDTETSGLPDWRAPDDAPGQPRLASYALLFVDDDLEIERRSVGLVKPDGWTMGSGAVAVNGLTQERLLVEGEPVAVALAAFQVALDERRTLVAYNYEFDAKVMRGERRRAGVAPMEPGLIKSICTMRGLTEACALPHATRAGGFKWPRLGEAVWIILGEELMGAHDALTDAKACLRLLRPVKRRS